MQFAPPRPRTPPRENIVPMINVVFLLLIFFLMTAQIAPPEPFEITPPESASTTAADTPDILYIAADGTLGFDGVQGDAALAALSRLGPKAPLMIRADSALQARELARLLPRLAAAGISQVSLVTGTGQ